MGGQIPFGKTKTKQVPGQAKIGMYGNWVADIMNGVLTPWFWVGFRFSMFKSGGKPGRRA